MSSAARKKSKVAARPKKPAARPAPRPKVKAKAKAAKPAAKAAARPAKPVPAPAKPAAPVKPQAKGAKPLAGAPQAKGAAPAPGSKGPAPAGAVPARPVPARPPSKKSARRSIPTLRRGPDGQPLQPGALLLPGGPQSAEEVQYLFRGVIASQRAPLDAAIAEVVAKRPAGDPLTVRPDLERLWSVALQRFATGSIELALPNRTQPKLSFQGFVERARQRRREIGAFLRGLDIGRTESSQMDAHGEDSLNKLMEWAARLEKAMDADEPAQADYSHFHRGLDVFDERTESLVVDIEKTLRRLGARVKS